MATINFKEEVLKVYPDAVSSASYNKYGDHLFLYTIKRDVRVSISKDFYNVDLAWQNAYDNIKNQTK